ncbi:MAG: DUF1501 domain-containing protein, partial [Ignavibacteriota bacterium]
ANDKILVIIQLAGGNDGLNCLIPYQDPTYLANRPTLGLKTSDKILTLSDHDTLAMHFNMTGAHDLYAAQKMAILQNVGYPNPNLSHFRGTDIWNTATDSGKYADTGWVGRMLYHPYQELEYVRIIQKETEVYTASIVARTQTTNKVTYPTNNNLATQLSNVAQLIASGFTTKIYLTLQGGYDTHSNQSTDQGNNLLQLSAAMKAFQDDLEAFGLADKVVTMTYSEFGRRPVENGGGTDHGTAAPLFVFGTQVVPGVKGYDPKLATANLVNGNLAYQPEHDFRNIYSSLMFEWLLSGTDSEKNALISNVLTASDGSTFSTSNDWLHLGIIKNQSTSVEAYQTEAAGLMLMENYPNPVSRETTIEYSLPEATNVQLGIFNSNGVEVARIVDQKQGAGIYKSNFKPGNLPSGSYIYRLSTPKGQVAKQMIVVK